MKNILKITRTITPKEKKIRRIYRSFAMLLLVTTMKV